jgi:hypothetical protein
MICEMMMLVGILLLDVLSICVCVGGGAVRKWAELM